MWGRITHSDRGCWALFLREWPCRSISKSVQECYNKGDYYNKSRKPNSKHCFNIGKWLKMFRTLKEWPYLGTYDIPNARKCLKYLQLNFKLCGSALTYGLPAEDSVQPKYMDIIHGCMGLRILTTCFILLEMSAKTKLVEDYYFNTHWRFALCPGKGYLGNLSKKFCNKLKYLSIW